MGITQCTLQMSMDKSELLPISLIQLYTFVTEVPVLNSHHFYSRHFHLIGFTHFLDKRGSIQVIYQMYNIKNDPQIKRCFVYQL